MNETEEKSRQQYKTTYLSMMIIFPLLFFALYMATRMTEDFVPFSFSAFIQPYIGENGFVSMVLGFFAFADLLLINLWMIPRFLVDQKGHLAALVLTEMFALFGFIIGFLNNNPWAAIPYFIVSFGNYIWVYVRVTQTNQ